MQISWFHRFLGICTAPCKDSENMLPTFYISVHVPNGRRLGHVNVIYVVVILHVWVGRWGKRGATGTWSGVQKWGSWVWAWGQQGQRFPATYKEPPFQEEGYLYIKYSESTTQAIIWYYVLCYKQKKKKTLSPLQFKNKPHDRDSEHAFIVGLMDCVVANSTVHARWKYWENLIWTPRWIKSHIIQAPVPAVIHFMGTGQIFMIFLASTSRERA